MSANVDEVGSANSTLQHVPMEKMNPSPRERRRSSISLAIPVCADQLAASVNIESHQVEFEAHGLKINRDGLFIEGANVSEIHQDDLRVLRELGRGACSVVMKAQVCLFWSAIGAVLAVKCTSAVIGATERSRSCCGTTF